MSDFQPPITLEMVDGTKVVLPDSLDQITPYVLQEQGDWFEDEIKFLRRLVQPGQTLVDIGANYGLYALSLGRRVGANGKVWAFEPASATADLLAQSITANGTDWVTLERQALSDHSGKAWLQTTGQSELNSLGPEQGPGEEVSLTTLDACLEEFGWQSVDLLKIDAEGEEERILAGGQRFFQELSPLVMFEVKAGADLHLELVEYFKDLGYDCFRLVPGLDALMPFDPAAGVDGYLLNLFAAKPDRISALAAEGWLVPAANPEPPEATELTQYHWSKVLASLPYGQALAPAWGQQESNGQSTAAEPLALWAFAQDSSQPVDRRLGAMQRSYRVLCEQARDKAQLTRQSSLARVAWELGERNVALRALGHLIPALEASIKPEATEPFLPPSARFDDIHHEGRLGEWLNAAALESDELLGHYSSFFTGSNARPRLERLQSLGFAGPAMQQRLALLDRRFPPRPSATPEMEQPNPEQIARSKEAFELIQAAEIEQGEARLEEAQALGDVCSQSLHFIGRALSDLGKPAEALSILQRAVELNPNMPSLLVDLGFCLRANGEPAAAEAIMQQAIWAYGFMLASGSPTAKDFTNLARAYFELGDTNQAIEMVDCALALDPAMESALSHKAMFLAGLADRHEEAMEIWQQLLAINPSNLGLICNRAKFLTDCGDVDEAIELLERVIEQAPQASRAHHLLAFAHSICGESAAEAHLKHLRGYWQQCRQNRTQGHTMSITFSLPTAAEKLRIGILSAELGDHVVSLFLEPFLQHYDRSRFEVELIEVHEHRTPRAVAFAKLADAVVTVQGLDMDIARQRLRSRGYHLIVETSGFTSNTGIELLVERCAPVQCHYLGFHASTGLDTIDWFIGDQLTAAEDLANQYVERLWPLSRLWLASRRESGLPDAESLAEGSRPVLGSFNQFGKVRTDTLRFWAAALKQVPEAKLHLKNFVTDSVRPRQRILEQLNENGIDPLRVVFLPRTTTRQDHLECYRSIDVALDSTPWAGATTTVEALMMGVPVVGIQGRATASRMSCSILRALGKEAWITRSPEAFAAAIAGLVGDLPALRAGRTGLRQQVLDSPIFDGADLAGHLQEAFWAMVRDVGTQGHPVRSKLRSSRISARSLKQSSASSQEILSKRL